MFTPIKRSSPITKENIRDALAALKYAKAAILSLYCEGGPEEQEVEQIAAGLEKIIRRVEPRD